MQVVSHKGLTASADWLPQAAANANIGSAINKFFNFISWFLNDQFFSLMMLVISNVFKIIHQSYQTKTGSRCSCGNL